MTSKADLARVLGHHIGAENGISADAIARLLDCEPRVVRALVTELRDEGTAVCGHPAHGYFIARTAEELAATCQFLRSRAMHSLVLESKLSRIPLAEMLGQIRLGT